jgi:hypothetical protein
MAEEQKQPSKPLPSPPPKEPAIKEAGGKPFPPDPDPDTELRTTK